MGLGDSWGTREEFLHPRDSHGRFRNTWRMAASVVDKLTAMLSAFNPKTFPSDEHAGSWLDGEARSRNKGRASSTRIANFVRGFSDVNAKLRKGDTSDPTVREMDAAMAPLPDDLILSRVVGPEAFGLTPETIGNLEEYTGKLVADRGYASTNLGTPLPHTAGQITLTIATPAGTRAVIPATGRPSREVILDRDQPLRITKVDPDGQGGFYVMAVATEKGGVGQKRPKKLGSAAPAPSVPTGEPGTPAVPGQTPATPGPVSNAPAPPAPAVAPAVPGAVPSAPSPQATPVRTGRPGRPSGPPPPPRTDGHVGIVGQGPGTPAPATPGAPQSPEPGTPDLPETPAPADPRSTFRDAFKEANLPVPGVGKRRQEYNDAFLGVTSGKKTPQQAVDELDDRIALNEATVRQDAEDGTDSGPLPRDIEAQRGLSDLIKTHFGLEGAKESKPKKAAPAKKVGVSARKAGAPKKASVPTPEPVKKVSAPVAKKAAPEVPKPKTGAEARKARTEKLRARNDAQGKSDGVDRGPQGEARKKARQDAIRDARSTVDRMLADKASNVEIADALDDLADRHAKKVHPEEANYIESRIGTIADRFRDGDPGMAKRFLSLQEKNEDIEPPKKAVKKAAPKAPEEITPEQQELIDRSERIGKVIEAKKPGEKLTPEEMAELRATVVGLARASVAERRRPAKKAMPEPVKKAEPAVPAVPEPAKKAAPVKALPTKAEGTAAGKITTSRVAPGHRILVRRDAKGEWQPTSRKTGAVALTVTGKDAKQQAGHRRARTRYDIHGKDGEGNEITVKDVAPSQTFFEAPEPKAPVAKKAAPEAPKVEAPTVKKALGRAPARGKPDPEAADELKALQDEVRRDFPDASRSAGGAQSVVDIIGNFERGVREGKFSRTDAAADLSNLAGIRLGVSERDAPLAQRITESLRRLRGDSGPGSAAFAPPAAKKAAPAKKSLTVGQFEIRPDDPSLPIMKQVDEGHFSWPKGKEPPGWTPAKTDKASKVLYDYMDERGDAAPWNLRGAAPSGEIREVVDEVMQHSSLHEDTSLWRGLKRPNHLFGDRLEGDLKGFTFTDHSYGSTSTQRSVAERYADGGVLTELRVPAGIGAVHLGDDDDEVLLDRNLELRVISDSGPGTSPRLVRMEVAKAKPKAAKKAAPIKRIEAPAALQEAVAKTSIADLRAQAAQEGIKVPASARTKQQIVDHITQELARRQLGTPAKVAPAKRVPKKATPKAPPKSPEQIKADLQNFQSRVEAERYLDDLKLTIPQMREVGEANNIHLHGNKTQMRDQLLIMYQANADNRGMVRAIHGKDSPEARAVERAVSPTRPSPTPSVPGPSKAPKKDAGQSYIGYMKPHDMQVGDVVELKDGSRKTVGSVDSRGTRFEDGSRPPVAESSKVISRLPGVRTEPRPTSVASSIAMSDKPLRHPNGGPGIDQGLMHFDSAIGEVWVKLPDDERRISVNGEPLANVIADIGEGITRGQWDTNGALARLREVRYGIPDGTKAGKLLDAAIAHLNVPPRPLPELPDLTPPLIHTLMKDLNDIALVRRAREYHNGSPFHETDEIAKLMREFYAGKMSSLTLKGKIESLLTERRHESQEGWTELRRIAARLAKMSLSEWRAMFPNPQQ